MSLGSGNFTGHQARLPYAFRPLHTNPQVLGEPNAESIGEDGVPLDQRIQGGIFHVAREPLGIEADGTGDGDDVIEVEGASAPSSAQ